MSNKTKVYEVRSTEGVFDMVVSKDGYITEVIPSDCETEFVGKTYHTVLSGLKRLDPFLSSKFVAAFQ